VADLPLRNEKLPTSICMLTPGSVRLIRPEHPEQPSPLFLRPRPVASPEPRRSTLVS